MRHIWLVLVVLIWAGACGGGGAAKDSGSGSGRKIADLENQLEDTQASLTKEKAARAAAEQQLAETKAKLAAAEAKAAAAAPPAGAPAAPPGTPPVAAVPPVPDPAVPPPPPKPVSARITEKKSTGSGVRVTIGAGTNRGVAVGWTGNVFQGKGSKLLTKFKVVAVREGECEGQVPPGMTLDVLTGNDRVELLAPGAVGTAQ